MLLSTHVMVGASLALVLAPDRPWLAFALGLASHFLIDAIPHGDSGLYRQYQGRERVSFAVSYVAVDAIVAVILTGMLLNLPFGQEDRAAMTLGVVGGVLPDLLTGLRELVRSRFLDGFYRVHFFFHNAASDRWGDIPLWAGVGAQGIGIAALLSLFR